MASPIMTTTTRDSALSAHMSQVFNYMAGGVGISGLVALLVSTSPALLQAAQSTSLIAFLGILGLSFFLQTIVFKLQPAAGLAMFAGFSALMGWALTPLVLSYTNSSIASAFGVAVVMFAGTAAYGYFTKKSLSGWGTFLVMGMWGLVGASLVTLLLSLFGINMGPMSMVINIIAIPLFAGITAWEVNTIRETFTQYGRDELTRSRLAILQAISLYINFINMFTSLLRLMGDRR